MIFSKFKYLKGFTLIEILLVLAITVGVFLLTVPLGLKFYQTQIVKGVRSEIINTLQQARQSSILQKNDSAFGVSFDAIPDNYIFFQGNSYKERESVYDIIFPLPDKISVSGLSNIVFSKLFGNPSVTGIIFVTYGDIIQSITIENEGINIKEFP